jgi:CheY-like chemotaxis protein
MAGTKRLDKILLELGLITEEQVRHALERQRTHGGKFGSALLYHRYLTEDSLVKALEIQSGCEGVTVADMDIPKEVLDLIPLKVAQARNVIPIDYIPDENLLKIAAADPHQPELSEELAFLARGKNVAIYVASGVAIDTAIERNYHGAERSLDDSLMLRIPNDLTAIDEEEPELDKGNSKAHTSGSRIVIVTDEEFSGPLIKSVIEREGPHVELVSSFDEAQRILSERFVETVFIRDTLSDDYAAHEAAIRAHNFRTDVRWFSDCSSLALGELKESSRIDSLRSIELLVSLLASCHGDRDIRSVTPGRYASRICQNLGIPEPDRHRIVTASFLRHLWLYSGDKRESPPASQKTIQRSANLLESLGFDSTLASILRKTYAEVSLLETTGALDIATLGGNIVTIADLFAENYHSPDKISLVKFEEIKRRFYDQAGKLFLPEVVDAFILVLQEDCLNQELVETRGEVVLYYHNNAHRDAFLAYHLRAKGLRVTDSPTPEDLSQVCQRRAPDALLLVLPDSCDDPLKVIEELNDVGVDLEEIPGILVANSSFEDSIDKLFQKGINDMIGDIEQYDTLCAKTLTLIERRRRNVKSSEESAAHGKLSNLNLIDLIQALGPGRKTSQITLRQDGEEIKIYLVDGAIVHAAGKDVSGPEAIFEGICWLSGSFTVKNITPQDAPPPNVELPNESVLMEGCRIMDERLRDGKL